MARNKLRQRSKSKNANVHLFPLIRLAKRHDIFVLGEDNGSIDFLDCNTGESLGHWYPFPKPHFFVRDTSYQGSPKDCLRVIVYPNEL